MTEKQQTSQGYIIRILQHFATKLRNITNFVMTDALSSCDEIFAQTCLDQNFTQKGNLGLLIRDLDYGEIVWFKGVNPSQKVRGTDCKKFFPEIIFSDDLPPPRRQKIFGQCTILRVEKNFSDITKFSVT